MNPNEILKEIKGIDVYLMDQFLKENIHFDQTILDAGCGAGRNINWLLKNDVAVFAIDSDPRQIAELKQKYPKQANNFTVSNVDEMPFEENTFDFVICNAVLHFAKNHGHFNAMFKELIRVLKKNGILFIRMTSDIGIENKSENKGDGIYLLPDGSTRYLVKRAQITDLIEQYKLEMIEAVKSVNVDGVRSMTTLVFNKK